MTDPNQHVRTASDSATTPVSRQAWWRSRDAVGEVSCPAAVVLRLEVCSRHGPGIVACFLLTVTKQIDDIRLCVVEELVHILV